MHSSRVNKTCTSINIVLQKKKGINKTWEDIREESFTSSRAITENGAFDPDLRKSMI